MQDLLGLGTDARMNLPGTVGGNWRWRMKPGDASPELARKMLDWNRQAERTDAAGGSAAGNGADPKAAPKKEAKGNQTGKRVNRLFRKMKKEQRPGSAAGAEHDKRGDVS